MDSFVKALTARHRKIEQDIAEEERRPASDRMRVLALKKVKLRLREQIEVLHREGRRAVTIVRRRRDPHLALRPAR
ncbi:YdcH family protein [Aquabacter spiritensis]|uniref:Uncharacterized protein DUF465 n=1 Tax=Aquabacter spiritensis TaxID=933073 RepID=A0A4R3M5R7_9HYPH|nr:DUF465 domain-containing protein [Aquabacter spiritensis]TCT08276.1 uncharacterized protein DUF465 [Aquabacter spiritensis]